MRFVEFRLKGFAQHVDTRIRFVDGAPNLIVGPNESGKSQLLTGLIGTIFGLPDWARHRPWSGESDLIGQLRLDVDGHDVRIERDFAEDRVDVHLDGEMIYTGRGRADRRSFDDERYQRLIGEWIGFTDVNVFRDVVFVEQDQLADERLAKRSGEIKRIISGSREASYETAIKDLDGRLDLLRRRGRQRNDREIELLESEVSELERRSIAAAEAEGEAVTLDDLERTARRKLEEGRQRRGQLNALFTGLTQRQRLNEELNRNNQLLSRVGRDAERARKVTEHTQKLQEEIDRLHVPGNPDPRLLREDRTALENATSACVKLSQQIDGISAEIERSQIDRHVSPTQQTTHQPRQSLLVATLLLAVGSALLGVVVSPIAFAGLLLAVILLVVALAPATRSQHQQSDAETVRLDLLKQRRSELQHDLAQAQERRDSIDARCQEWLTRSGEPDIDALLSRMDRHREATVRLAEHGQNELDIETTEVEKQDALTAVAITQRRLEQLDEEMPELNSIDPERAAELRLILERLSTEEERLTNELSDVDVRRRVLQAGSPDDAAAVNVQIREKRSELERKRRLASALELAIATMRSSVEEFQEQALDPVAQQAGGFIARITDGRYRELEMDQESMTPTLHGVGPGALELDDLSRGTRDQVYLALRVGLVDALSGGRQLPIILDDPCVHFDDERLEATVRLLQEIAQLRQVIILTKDESYTRWFPPVLRLISPSSQIEQNHRESASSAPSLND